MKLTVTARVVPDLQSRLRARTERQKAAVKAVNLEEAPQMVAAVQSITPKDTEYMANHARYEITNDGYGLEAGWWTAFFVGETNPVTGKVVTEDYYKHVILGTRLMAGRDPLTPTLEARWPQLRQKYLKALSQ